MKTWCTDACWAMPTCSTCGRTKQPRGRDAPASSGYCDTDCPGYQKEPRPGHLWPGDPPTMEDPDDFDLDFLRALADGRDLPGRDLESQIAELTYLGERGLVEHSGGRWRVTEAGAKLAKDGKE